MMGKGWHKSFTRRMEEYIKITDVDDAIKYLDGSTEIMMTIGLICYSDQTRTEEFMKDLWNRGASMN